MNKTLVTGASGQLGSEIKSLVNDDVNYTFLYRADVDLSNPSALESYLKGKHFDVIINCAAYTAVDKAEEEPSLAYVINESTVDILARYAKANSAKMVHISTDYVYDGKNFKPYNEEDQVAPQNIYGKSKLAGEEALKKINPQNSIIIRTSWVYSSFGNNFVKTMLRLGKERDTLGIIFDQVGSPTYAKDLAQAILEIVPQLTHSNVKVFHYSNEGVCSWYDFAKAIFEIENIECNVNPIETKEYPTPASRPHYSLLNKAKIKKEYNITIPYWKNALYNCLRVIDATN